MSKAPWHNKETEVKRALAPWESITDSVLIAKGSIKKACKDIEEDEYDTTIECCNCGVLHAVDVIEKIALIKLRDVAARQDEVEMQTLILLVNSNNK